MTNQEVFDKVVNHLRQQGCQSTDPNVGCAYRGVNGTMCAVGCLITDEAYDPFFEGLNIYGRDVRRALRESGIPITDNYKDPLFMLLRRMQDVHDSPVLTWEMGFKSTAAVCGLTYTEPTK